MIISHWILLRMRNVSDKSCSENASLPQCYIYIYIACFVRVVCEVQEYCLFCYHFNAFFTHRMCRDIMNICLCFISGTSNCTLQCFNTRESRITESGKFHFSSCAYLHSCRLVQSYKKIIIKNIKVTKFLKCAPNFNLPEWGHSEAEAARAFTCSPPHGRFCLSVFTVIDNSMTLTTYPCLAHMLKVGRSIILPVLCASSGMLGDDQYHYTVCVCVGGGCTGESLVAQNISFLPNCDLSLSKTLYWSL